MPKSTRFRMLFVDVGGVLLTNGWDRHARQRASEKFDLDLNEMEIRHNLTFDTYEVGKLSLDDYLKRTVFYTRRSFTPRQFQTFMFAQSKPFPEMIALVRSLKEKHGLKVAVVSNEGRELNAHRIRKFKLESFIDFFISSSFVHFRKPDADIYRVALDISQIPASETLYIEDRKMFVEVAESLGIRGLLHVDYQSTLAKLRKLGL